MFHTKLDHVLRDMYTLNYNRLLQLDKRQPLLSFQVQFSAKLEGFLRWGGGKGGDTTNFHQKYHGSEERPEVPYTIGSSTEPLYKFLKTVSQRGDNMWMWNDMKQKYEWLPKVIDALTNEKLYEFELEGNFHDVSGLSMDVNWSDVAI